MPVKLVTDGAAMALLLRGEQGPVFRMLMERSTRVQRAAQAQAPVRTGCLRDSIVKRFEEDELGLAVRIVSDTTPCSPERKSYSYWVHEGTQPHDIQAAPGKVLAFQWDNGPDGPGMYFFRTVHHPGTAPNRFLSDNLPLALM